MDLTFGQNQYQMSRRMQRYPRLGRLVQRVFGHTNVGNYARAGIFRKLLKQLPLHRFDRVLDLGCGQGEYTFMLAEALPQVKVTALDIEPERIRRIRQIGETSGIKNLATYVGALGSHQAGEGYDLIFSIDVFEHIAEEDMPFEDAFACLREGGYLLVKMPSRKQRTILPESWFEEHQEWLEDEHIGQIYDLEGLKQRMEKAGFRITYSTYADGLLARMGWEIGYLSRRTHPLLQLLCLPFAKLLVRLDQAIHQNGYGNTIQVIGQKVTLNS